MIPYKKPLWLVKLLHFEYWTWWLFYLPLIPWYLWQAFRAKSLTFFTNVDPCIDYGGFFGESKIAILEKINKAYLPKTIFLNSDVSFAEAKKMLLNEQIQFPFICKPNIGERGTNVEKIVDEVGFFRYFSNLQNIIVQEYIDYQIELGVLYYRLPNAAKGSITSITKKGFLKVAGDGKSSILQLMELSDRARFQVDSMKKKLAGNINKIPEMGHEIELEPIGNHCRGTTFFDNNFLINQQLSDVFDAIAIPIEGFHYGRFDLRVKSIEDLYQGKNIKIMELNGVSADPGHIYDPNYKLFRAYADVAKHWRILADISIEQSKLGEKPIPVSVIWPVVKSHFFS
jgi:hypothetical protein